MIKQGPPEKAFIDAMKKYGVRDYQNPLHYYDYYGAWRAGEAPDKAGHWASKYKHELHPNRYIKENGQWLDTITGKSATEEDVMIQGMKRQEQEGNSIFE